MKTMTKRLLAAMAALLALTAGAEIPAGYYASLNGKSDADLKNAICKLTYNFTQVSGYNDLPKYFQKTDVYPQSNRWWDMYGNIPLYAPSFSGLNREHSFPKSWWGGLTTVPAYVDLNHLYPSEMTANSAKSNFPLGTVDMTQTVKFDNGVSKVGYPVTGQGGGCKSVFEPADEYKGDFARTYFYMVTTYQNLTWNKSYMYMLQQNTYPTLTGWAINLLLQWHRQDPVSDKETMRNDAVYGIQNNRNPFIDYPELAEHIWGRKMGVAFNAANSGTQGDPVLITPVQDMALDFGEVAIGKTATAKLFFKGQYLSEPLSITVYTGDRTLFTLPTRTIAANLVNAEDGYWLPVTYTPAETGQHTSRLLISGGGIPGSRGIELRGQCLPVPTLSAPVASEATAVTENSYTANWTSPADETVDYYEVTRTRYVGGVATAETLLAEQNSLDITDMTPGSSETYSVRSVRLGYSSPASNTITVQSAGVTDIMTDSPLALVGLPGAIRFVCSQPHTGVAVFDTTGRLVRTAATVNNNTDIDLGQGIYLVVTDQCRRPLRVSVR